MTSTSTSATLIAPACTADTVPESLRTLQSWYCLPELTDLLRGYFMIWLRQHGYPQNGLPKMLTHMPAMPAIGADGSLYIRLSYRIKVNGSKEAYSLCGRLPGVDGYRFDDSDAGAQYWYFRLCSQDWAIVRSTWLHKYSIAPEAVPTLSRPYLEAMLQQTMPYTLTDMTRFINAGLIDGSFAGLVAWLTAGACATVLNVLPETV